MDTLRKYITVLLWIWAGVGVLAGIGLGASVGYENGAAGLLTGIAAVVIFTVAPLFLIVLLDELDKTRKAVEGSREAIEGNMYLLQRLVQHETHGNGRKTNVAATEPEAAPPDGL